MSENEEIIKIIETFFESGKTKDFSHLKEIHLDDSKFSSFSDLPPYDMKDVQNYNRARRIEIYQYFRLQL